VREELRLGPRGQCFLMRDVAHSLGGTPAGAKAVVNSFEEAGETSILLNTR